LFLYILYIPYIRAKIRTIISPPSIGKPGGGVGGGGGVCCANTLKLLAKKAIITNFILIGTKFIGCKSKKKFNPSKFFGTFIKKSKINFTITLSKTIVTYIK
jgi:hypothetical protein